MLQMIANQMEQKFEKFQLCSSYRQLLTKTCGEGGLFNLATKFPKTDRKNNSLLFSEIFLSTFIPGSGI